MLPLETPGEGPSSLLQLLVPHVSLGLWPHHPISASVVMWLLSLCVSVSFSLCVCLSLSKFLLMMMPVIGLGPVRMTSP